MTILHRGSKTSRHHTHTYQTIAASAGLTRHVCSDCQHVSIDAPHASIQNGAFGKPPTLFSAPPPKLGLRPEELLPVRV